ncbi:MAG: hypothetical protein PHU98_06200 [Mariniphaga sp.]|nr:hypothetical protein [Mariniphaga sp.]
MDQVITVENCKKLAKKLGYKIFEDTVNIWGIRTPKGAGFNDFLLIWGSLNGMYREVFGTCTTEPSAGYVETLMASGKSNKNGIFVLKTGQYINCWKKGLHKGKYPALVQAPTAKFVGYRKKTDEPENYYSGKLWYDVEGLNFHSTKPDYERDNIGGFSEGCIVQHNFDNFKDITIPFIYNFPELYSFTLVDLQALIDL